MTNLNPSGEPDAWFQGFDIATGDMPAGWSFTVQNAHEDFCARVIPAGGVAARVGVRINIGAEAASNTTYTLNSINRDGFRFVRSDFYVPGDCF